jgi:hypothetical protein
MVMKNINIKKLFKSKVTGNIIILTASIVLIYLLVSIYFAKHYFFNTIINGVNVSLKAHDDVNDEIKSYIKDYKLHLIERNDKTEEIIGQDIEVQYNEKNSISKIDQIQHSFKWMGSLFKVQKYYVDDLFVYNKDNLENRINELNCLNKDIIESQNVGFKYSNGSYEVIEEVYGNKINKDKLKVDIENSILKGETKLDLNENHCYEDPKYTLNSDKTLETKNLLNNYVKAKITYIFGSDNELLDENIINQWLSVDENLDVVVSEKAVFEYVLGLSKKYDTVGVPRNFKTSLGKKIRG